MHDTPQPPTAAPTESSTHAHTAVPRVEQLHLSVQQLHNEDASLKRQVVELTSCCNDIASQLDNVTLQLAQFTTDPWLFVVDTKPDNDNVGTAAQSINIYDDFHHKTLRRGWHEQANDKIGASHFRENIRSGIKVLRVVCVLATVTSIIGFYPALVHNPLMNMGCPCRVQLEDQEGHITGICATPKMEAQGKHLR